MNIDSSIINKLYESASKAFSFGEIPVSAAIIDSNGKLVCLSCNSRQSNNNVLNHAEIDAIVKAERLIGDWRLDGYSMISTLEPCDLCSAVIHECRLDHVFYLLKRNNSYLFGDSLISKSELAGYDDIKEKLSILLTGFFEDKR